MSSKNEVEIKRPKWLKNKIKKLKIGKKKVVQTNVSGFEIIIRKKYIMDEKT
jgi:hypothetical protein